SFTVLFRQGGEVEHGVVMLRTEQDTRTLARVPATDIVTLAQLMNMERTPVGALGDITMAADGVPEWRVA
ncbi:MAG: acetyl-CoA acetyltransferase, partial [Bradyrhizobium sp.]|nr:acetyl-CoA acetyltransferase [Bradyrhizobium sp.]